MLNASLTTALPSHGDLLAFLPGMGISPSEMLIVGVIALLLFGERLPEVARSLGKSWTEFKNGLHGITRDIDRSTRAAGSSPPPPAQYRPPPAEERVAVTAPKFEPPALEPQEARTES